MVINCAKRRKKCLVLIPVFLVALVITKLWNDIPANQSNDVVSDYFQWKDPQAISFPKSKMFKESNIYKDGYPNFPANVILPKEKQMKKKILRPTKFPLRKKDRLLQGKPIQKASSPVYSQPQPMFLNKPNTSVVVRKVSHVHPRSADIQNYFIPPSGPEPMTGPGESLKTSQQVSVQVPQMQNICFNSQGVPIYPPPKKPSKDYICYPANSQQSHPVVTGVHSLDNGNLLVQVMPGSYGNTNHHEDQPQKPNQILHVPTAISSPNPFYFPTMSGSPIFPFTPWTPSYNPSQNYHSEGPQPPTSFPYNRKEKPNPYYFPSQPSTPQKHPVFCVSVPVPNNGQVIKFPKVQGVTENIQRNSLDPPSARQNVQMNKWDNYYSMMNDTCLLRGMIGCRDGTICLDKSKWCDGKVHCQDLSDELECSCKDRISKHKLCDGIFDCPQGEDEAGCPPCGEGSFSCKGKSRQKRHAACFPLSSRCDFRQDCPGGEDEVDCVRLIDKVNNNQKRVAGYGHGYVHLNYRDQWYPVCIPSQSDLNNPNLKMMAGSACKAEYGSDMYDKLNML